MKSNLNNISFSRSGLRRLPLTALGGIGPILLLVFPALALAEPSAPLVEINTGALTGTANSGIYTGLKLALLLSSLTFLPALVMTTTCFTRITVVLALSRQALGTAQTPPNQVVVGLSMFLTFAIMGPVFEQIYDEALIPYTEDQIDHEEAFSKAFSPLRDFMLRHTRESDLELFVEITKSDIPESPETLGANIVVPAFILSELNTAFQIGFLIFLPFLILDMVVSSILTSMSMITLPPTVISMPIKLMLFVVIDGWHLIIGNLVRSYQV